MPEPLNAPESLALGYTALSATTPAKGRGTPRGAYPTPPRKCELCVPVVRIVEDSYYLNISEASHEAGCPNHPRNTQSAKEL
ncbi:hypothetical protein ABH924_000146 [Arthrobacter sp. GAS37]